MDSEDDGDGDEVYLQRGVLQAKHDFMSVVEVTVL